MNNKRMMAALLAGALAFSLAGCGAPASTASQPQSQAASAASTPADTAAQSAAPAVAVGGDPLTGGQTADATQRPVAVTITNGTTRQWGIADASVVVEALTVGKTTELMLWYPALASVPKVGPVAQGRDVLWQFALPMNSLLVQKGMNIFAENLLNCYAYQPIDAELMGVNSFDYDNSDPAMADEYCWYTKAETLQNALNTYGMSATGTVPQWLSFGAAAAPAGQAASVSVAYADTSATVLSYSADTGLWAMAHADGSPYQDANTGAQPAFTNVILLSCAGGIKDDGFTRDYDLSGGTGLYLTAGGWQSITWQKGDAAAPLALYAADGSPLSVAPGRTYLGVYGGFGGQSVTVYDAAGAPVETGFAAVQPAAAAG